MIRDKVQNYIFAFLILLFVLVLVVSGILLWPASNKNSDSHVKACGFHTQWDGSQMFVPCTPVQMTNDGARCVTGSWRFCLTCGRWIHNQSFDEHVRACGANDDKDEDKEGDKNPENPGGREDEDNDDVETGDVHEWGVPEGSPGRAGSSVAARGLASNIANVFRMYVFPFLCVASVLWAVWIGIEFGRARTLECDKRQRKDWSRRLHR